MGKHYNQLNMNERNEIHRCQNEGSVKLQSGSPLFARVHALIRQGWSQEQVADRLQRMNPDDLASHISHETIYELPRGELRSELIAWGYRNFCV